MIELDRSAQHGALRYPFNAEIVVDLGRGVVQDCREQPEFVSPDGNRTEIENEYLR